MAVNRRGPRRRGRGARFSAADLRTIDYKDLDTLRRFLGDGGALLPRRIAGIDGRSQRRLTTAVMRARRIALLPYVENSNA